MDLFSQEFNSLSVFTEDDSLVNVELAKQRVEALEFLFLLQVGVVLSDTLQGEFVHEIDILGIWNILSSETLDSHGVSCGEK